MKKVLVIDNAYATRALYKYMFLDLGYDVDTAANGREAMEKTVSFLPNCILVDMVLPEISGVEFVKTLRSNQNPSVSNIPFIMLTDDIQPVPLGYSLSLSPSCKGVLPKLSNPDVVVQAVRDVIET